MHQLWIIAGPNGSGKTTLTQRHLAGRLPVLNPDEIALEIDRRREYIVHLMPPRLVARVVETDADSRPVPEEMPADVISGTVYVAGPETLLCEVGWFDAVDPGEIRICSMPPPTLSTS
jgi:Uncharacterized protein conserved in bacteria